MLALTLIWLLLADFDLSSLLIGLPCIGAASWLVGYLSRPGQWRLSVIGLLRLAGYFTEQTLRGAWDIASRTCGPHVRVTPGFIDYSRQFPHRSARTLFISCVNLLPGTLAVSAHGNQFSMHVVDLGRDHKPQLDRLGHLIEQLWMDRNAGAAS
ncbi:Na+/H+ antiporter subunit E [Motiliproteus sp. SC1-56]|uniref:Na+/H+ antiporter subunit E n=1 Tax=Motiliproteus sp. SC1-56 TaxID=2799565 RepID=UPI001A8F1EB6|nr:Na+/H+ antiporter subunit E [Motiliproteus sp. SC1-56]